jgi:hypothetical protein
MIRLLLGIIFLLAFNFTGFSQLTKDSTKTQKIDTANIISTNNYLIVDSVALARKSFIADSLTYQYIKPNPQRINPYYNQLVKDFFVTDPFLLSSPKGIKVINSNYGLGLFIKKSPKLFIFIFLFILVFFGVVKVLFSKELSNIFKAFYDNRFLAQFSKDDNYLFSWQFLFLFIILSLTVGLFISLILFKYFGNQSVIQIETFLILTLASFTFFFLKIVVLKFFGHLFLVQKLTKDYINFICITLFNSIFLLFPIILCLILLDTNHENYIIEGFLLFFLLVFSFQFVRIAINVLLNYRLSIFYLILYLCALEICPLILFAKTINISL